MATTPSSIREIDTAKMPLTVRKLIGVLSDGYWHVREDLFKCLNSRRETGPNSQDLRNYLYLTRQHLRLQGYTTAYRTREDKHGKAVVEWAIVKPKTMEEDEGPSTE